MLLGDIRLTADDHVQLIDVDGSVQCELTISNTLDFHGWCIQKRELLLYRYSQQQAKERKNKETEQ